MSAHSTHRHMVDRIREPHSTHTHTHICTFRKHSVHAQSIENILSEYVYYPICFIQYMHYASTCKANVVIVKFAHVFRDSVQFHSNTDLRMKIKQLQQHQHRHHSMGTFKLVQFILCRFEAFE